jgi:hypothetical protein
LSEEDLCLMADAPTTRLADSSGDLFTLELENHYSAALTDQF